MSDNPDHDAAMDWAAALACDVLTIDLDALRERWQGPDGTRHQETLKTTGQVALRQLRGLVMTRVEELKRQSA